MDKNEDAALIMRLAMESADDYVEKQETDIEIKIGKAKKTPFILTDEEAVEVANQRLAFRGYSLVNPSVYRKIVNDAIIYTQVTEQNIKNSTSIDIILFGFSGNLKIGDCNYNDDGLLRVALTSQMIKKYGETYKIAYAKFWAKQQQEWYQKDGDLLKHACKFERRLTAIGKKATRGGTTFILGDFDYGDLEDL